MFKMKNKKANIPILILVIGVVAICVLSIMAFYFPNDQVKKDFSGIIIISEVNSIIDQIKFYENIKKNPEDLIKELNKKIDEGISNNRKFYVEMDGDKKILHAIYYSSEFSFSGDRKELYHVQYELS